MSTQMTTCDHIITTVASKNRGHRCTNTADYVSGESTYCSLHRRYMPDTNDIVMTMKDSIRVRGILSNMVNGDEAKRSYALSRYIERHTQREDIAINMYCDHRGNVIVFAATPLSEFLAHVVRKKVTYVNRLPRISVDHDDSITYVFGAEHYTSFAKLAKTVETSLIRELFLSIKEIHLTTKLHDCRFLYY